MASSSTSSHVSFVVNFPDLPSGVIFASVSFVENCPDLLLGVIFASVSLLGEILSAFGDSRSSQASALSGAETFARAPWAADDAGDESFLSLSVPVVAGVSVVVVAAVVVVVAGVGVEKSEAQFSQSFVLLFQTL